jgi:hypothetical protein
VRRLGGWHDGAVIATARVRVLLVLLFGLLLGVARPAGIVSADTTTSRSAVSSPALSTTALPSGATPDTLPEANVYLPEDRNLSDCLSSLPKPGCGSEQRGGAIQLVTFAVLMLGMAFIGWRIFLGVRRRDRANTPTP